MSLKDRILDVAMKYFAERGIRAVKMDDIAQALGISKRTLYEIYDDKETLLYAGLVKHHEQHRQRMEQLLGGESTVMDFILKFYRLHLEEMSNVNPQFYVDIEKYPKLLSTLHREEHDKKQFFLDFMKRGVREGYFLEGINYELIGHVFDALGKYMMENHLYETYTFKELYGNMLFVTLRGFCTTKGITILDEAILRKK